jgi:hypothetical protein
MPPSGQRLERTLCLALHDEVRGTIMYMHTRFANATSIKHSIADIRASVRRTEHPSMNLQEEPFKVYS